MYTKNQAIIQYVLFITELNRKDRQFCTDHFPIKALCASHSYKVKVYLFSNSNLCGNGNYGLNIYHNKLKEFWKLNINS